MSAPAHADPTSGVWKSEPVIAAHVAAWFVLNAGLLLVGRFHVLTAAQWSGLAASLTAVVTAALIGAMAWLVRRVVAPAWKVTQAEAARLGVTLPDLPLPDLQPISCVPLAGTAPPDGLAIGLPALTADQLLNLAGPSGTTPLDGPPAAAVPA